MAAHLYANKPQHTYTHQRLMLRGVTKPIDEHNIFYEVARRASKRVSNTISHMCDSDVLRPEFMHVITASVLSEWVSNATFIGTLDENVDYMGVVNAISRGMWRRAPRMLPQSINIWESRVRCAVRPLVRAHAAPQELLQPITVLVGSSANETLVLEKVFSLIQHSPSAPHLIKAMAVMSDEDRGHFEALVSHMFNTLFTEVPLVVDSLARLARRDIEDIMLVARTVYGGCKEDAGGLLITMVDLLEQPTSSLRSVKLAALSKNMLYPDDTDWDAVADAFEHTSAPELVEAMFGAQPYSRLVRLV